MTILSMNRKELEKYIGPVDQKMQDSITDMGTPIEFVNDDEVAVEVFPNRPDLLSVHNFARAVRQYLGKAKIATFKINPPKKDYVVKIDKSVKGVRPHTVCAIVRGINFNDEIIKDVIDIQEKLHNSIGRKRKKLAIGIYPLDKITLPITYKADKPENIKFQPLEFPKIINARQILRQHPTGREYADLLKGYDEFAFFVDAAGEILSVPPIINSNRTGRITEKTKDVFIECSGSNLYYLKKTLNIMIAAFSSIGGKIFAMKVIDKQAGNFISPDMSFGKMEFRINDINKTLGLKLIEKDIVRFLSRMGIGFEKHKGKSFALIPAYRIDILHWIDLTEEVAIAYGYDNFEPIIPKLSTIAGEDPKAIMKRRIGNILSGLNLLEVSSFHLSTKKNTKKIHFNFNDFIELEDSKTEKDILRHDLLSNQLQILSENSDSSYPQKIFEMGVVFDKDDKEDTGVGETERLSISMIDEKVNFTELKQVLDYLFKMLDIKYEIGNNDEHPAYIKGRAGVIKVDGKTIGYMGEIAPRVLKNWKIKMPIVALEIDIDFLLKES